MRSHRAYVGVKRRSINARHILHELYEQRWRIGEISEKSINQSINQSTNQSINRPSLQIYRPIVNPNQSPALPFPLLTCLNRSL